MPIYAYRCESCGFGKDVLQKLSDAPLTQCPECGADTFRKQVTAAGFQLKGSGWYVTDFRGGNASNANGKSGASAEAGKSDSGKSDSSTSDSGKSDSSKSDSGSSDSGSASSGTAAASSAAAPAASGGASGS
ncbi:MAG TPA: FmdB family zinc ribbon protein [Paraburkholderia sp.]|nr:FmdB family zinc ribbon protein [Paraburkholderia sp.]